MKKSARVVLTLMSGLLVSGCSREPDLVRDTYISKEDCVADWGDDTKCQEARVTHTGTGHGYSRYYGPAYRNDQPPPRPTPNLGGASGHSLGTETVRRGGFGSSSGYFSSGSAT
jgi:uncharacterized protein YgiB involved in biofilm formation